MTDPMAGWPTFEETSVKPGGYPGQGAEGLLLSPVDAPALSPRVRTTVRVPSSARCTVVRHLGSKDYECSLAAGHESEQDHF